MASRSDEPNQDKERTMFKVTFYVFCKVLKKEFRNVEIVKSMDDARLRALALGWQIEKMFWHPKLES
jgi:hypothetical protein